MTSALPTAKPGAWSRNVWWAGRDPAHLFIVFTTVLNSIGTVWILFLMGIICADITARGLFNAPIYGVTEIVGTSIVCSVFLQLANTIHVRRITRADAFFGWLQRERPRAAAVFDFLFHLVGATVFILIAWGIWPVFLRALEHGTYFGIPDQFTFKVWPVKFLIMFGAAVAALEFILLAFMDLRSLRTREYEDAEANKDAPFGWGFLAILGGLILTGLWVVMFDLSNAQVGLLSIAAMLILIYAGMHVGITLTILSFLGLWVLKGSTTIGIKFLALAAGSAIQSQLFGVVPLFVLMGLVVSAANIGKETFEVAQWLLYRVKGGLGVATVAANAVFAAITGISIASASVFARVAVPPMLEHGYTTRFAVGVVAGSSVLGMLIPPSLLLIVYGLVAEVSVGALFTAAIIPGLLLASAFALAIVAMAYFWPSYVGGAVGPAPEIVAAYPAAWSRKGAPHETIGSAARKLLPIVFLVTVVLGGIYGGVFTPTESGAAGAFFALVIAAVRRSLSFKVFWRVLVETGHISVSILFLIIAANLYGRMLTLSGLPANMMGYAATAELGFYSTMVIYVIVILFLGMILDSISIMLITLPLILPVVAVLGVGVTPDLLVWFGVVTVIAVEIGLLTPPLGLTVYVVKASLGNSQVTLGDIFRGAFPFVIIMILVTIILIAFPQITVGLL